MANGDLIFILFHHFWTRMPLCVGIPGIVSGLAKNNPTKAHKSQVYMGYMLSYKHGLTTTYNSWVAHQKKEDNSQTRKKIPVHNCHHLQQLGGFGIIATLLAENLTAMVKQVAPVLVKPRGLATPKCFCQTEKNVGS